MNIRQGILNDDFFVLSTRGRNLKISEVHKQSLDVSYSFDMTGKRKFLILNF